MKLFSPKYLFALKKGEVADFRHVCKSELCHYQSPEHYKVYVGLDGRPTTSQTKKLVNKRTKELKKYRKSKGIPEQELPLSLRVYLKLHWKWDTRKITPFEERVKYCKTTSNNGLYPPEVILLNEINNNPQKYPLSEGEYYSDSWWFNYGMVDMLSHIEKLEKTGLIEKKNGKFVITDKGVAELSDNGEILWADSSKITDHGDMWGIKDYINKDLPEKYSNKPWDFKVEYRYKQRIADAINRKEIDSAKCMMAGMARFYDYIGDNKKCLETYKDILILKQQYKEYDSDYLLSFNEDEFLKKKIAKYQEKLK